MAGSAMSNAQETPPRPGHPPGPPPPSHVDGARKDAPQAMRMRMAMQRVAELHRAGKHDEANQLATRLRAAIGEKPKMDHGNKDRQAKDRPEVRKHEKTDRPVAPIAEARMKMQRLKQAAQLLQDAGYPDQAAKARQEIERIEVEARREAEKAKAKMEAEKAKTHREPAEKKVDDGMREEMKKLRRENEELLGQIKKMKAEIGDKKPDRKRDEKRDEKRDPR